MKLAQKINLSGIVTDVVLVEKSTEGLIPHYEIPEVEVEEVVSSHVELYPELVGYIVAIKLPDGLYEPTFNVEGYTKEKESYDELYEQYLEELRQYNIYRNDPDGDDLDSEITSPIPPIEPDWSSFWSNGLTDEEIEALKPVPVPTEMELLTERVESLEEEGTETQLALVETYEEVLDSQKENTDTQLALVDVYEQLLVLQERVAELTEKLEAS